MGGGADVHVGVVQHEVFEVDELACEVQTGTGVGVMGAGGPAVANGAGGETLVEPCERILGGRERRGELRPWQWIGDMVGAKQGLVWISTFGRNGILSWTSVPP